VTQSWRHNTGLRQAGEDFLEPSGTLRTPMLTKHSNDALGSVSHYDRLTVTSGTAGCTRAEIGGQRVTLPGD